MTPLVLGSRYEVQEQIAQGGMGIVYKALDQKLKHVVALKVVHPHLTSDASFLRRFLHEAHTMARLQHDNIVTIYDVEEDQKTKFLVMEFCPGQNLHDIIRRHPLPAVRMVINLSQQLASALAYAHAQDIIHRDIKPANIMVNQRGKVKLTDFGLAAALGETSLTSAGQVIGTPEYMSPEQARGLKLDGRSDLYSLGIVMYEMLTGRTPYGESPKTSILGKLAYDKEDLALQFPNQVPPLMQGVVRDLLRCNPDERIPDAETLASQLHEILYALPQTPIPAQEESEPTMVFPASPSHADERTSTISPDTATIAVPPRAEAPLSSTTHPAPPMFQQDRDKTTVLLEPPSPPSRYIPAPSTSPVLRKWWQFWKRRDQKVDDQRGEGRSHKLQGTSESEPVLLGASAPQNVLRGQAFTARFVAYSQAFEGKVEKVLEKLSPDSAIDLGLKTCRWKKGTDVAVHLSGQYLEVQCPTQTFKWEGRWNLVDFDVSVARDAPLGTSILKYDVSIHEVIVARVRLDITISRLSSVRTVKAASLRPAETAFASYASEDRSRVLDRVAAVRISAGLDVWMDCLSLNPGEEWKPRLHQEICQRDLFLLFWSHHAKES